MGKGVESSARLSPGTGPRACPRPFPTDAIASYAWPRAWTWACAFGLSRRLARSMHGPLSELTGSCVPGLHQGVHGPMQLD